MFVLSVVKFSKYVNRFSHWQFVSYLTLWRHWYDYDRMCCHFISRFLIYFHWREQKHWV